MNRGNQEKHARGSRAGLAAFLRARRGRVSPQDAGLPTTGRRRTPGLRRQEVAQLAGMSVDYYIRLEQGRGPHPSRQVLSALARALMLSGDERDYLFRMAGQAPPQPARPSREITPGVRHLLDSMPVTPAYVVDAAYNILAWNQLATHFIGNLAGHADRNMIRWTFRRSPTDVIWSDEHFLRFTRSTVADLRAGYGRYPGDPEIESLVTEMLALSPQFADMWAEHDVESRGPMLKHVAPPCRTTGIRMPGPAHRRDRPASHRLLRQPWLRYRAGIHPARRAHRARLTRRRSQTPPRACRTACSVRHRQGTASRQKQTLPDSQRSGGDRRTAPPWKSSQPAAHSARTRYPAPSRR